MLDAGVKIHLSAPDLVSHLNCRHLTDLDLAVARGTLAKPSVWDPVLELLAQRGGLHEESYVKHPCGDERWEGFRQVRPVRSVNGNVR